MAVSSLRDSSRVKANELGLESITPQVEAGGQGVGRGGQAGKAPCSTAD